MEAELKNLIDDIVNKYLSYISSDALKDFVFSMVDEQYNKGLSHAEINFNQNFVPDYNSLSFVQNFAFSNVRGLTEDMKESLRKEMSLGLMNHESVSELKLRILDVMDTTIERAEMITRTESNRAFNLGHYQAARDSGLILKKQWSSQNERVSRAGNLVPCPRCEAMNGVTIKMNDKFRFDDGEELLLPPKHPHCACRVIYVQ